MPAAYFGMNLSSGLEEVPGVFWPVVQASDWGLVRGWAGSREAVWRRGGRGCRGGRAATAHGSQLCSRCQPPSNPNTPLPDCPPARPQMSVCFGGASAVVMWLYYKIGPKRRYKARLRDMRSLRCPACVAGPALRMPANLHTFPPRTHAHLSKHISLLAAPLPPCPPAPFPYCLLAQRLADRSSRSPAAPPVY